jgi:hypothetical protein
MTAPTVEAAIHELMDLAWNVVYDPLEQRGLLGDGLFVEEYIGIHFWLDGTTRYTVVHSREVAVLFVDTRPVSAIAFHHDILSADDPQSFFDAHDDGLHGMFHRHCTYCGKVDRRETSWSGHLADGEHPSNPEGRTYPH